MTQNSLKAQLTHPQPPTHKKLYQRDPNYDLITTLIGIFGLGSFPWDRLLGIFRLGTFAGHLSLGNFRWETFAPELSLEIFRLGTFVWEVSVESFRLESFACFFLSGSFA
jgi:hypothetical protein